MDYRRYRSDDFAALYAVEKVCFEPPFRFESGYMRRVVSASNAATWIAEDAGQMVGFAIVEWTGMKPQTSAYILTVEVLPTHRGKGVGAELLRRLEGSARGEGARSIWLHVDQANDPAIRLYEKQGYLAAGEEEHFYAPDRGAYLYRKDIEAQ